MSIALTKLVQEKHMRSILVVGCTLPLGDLAQLLKISNTTFSAVCGHPGCRASKSKMEAQGAGWDYACTTPQRGVDVSQNDAVVVLARVGSGITRWLAQSLLQQSYQSPGKQTLKYLVVVGMSPSNKMASIHFQDLPNNGRKAYKLTHESYKNVFSNIYAKQVWGPDGGGSGLGSSLDYTAKLRTKLVALLLEHKITSMLDAPCGAMVWMPDVIEQVRTATATKAWYSVAPTPGKFKYQGLDVACPVIEQNKERFRPQSKYMTFQCMDMANDPLPAGYDLIFSRDALQHLPYAAIYGFLSNVKSSGIKFLLVGSYINSAGNHNINAGDYFPIDLRRPPFNVLPAPISILNEETPDNKHLLMYDVSQMTWDTTDEK